MVGAFSYREKLTSIVIPAGVTSIGDRAFEHCGLDRVTIPSGVTNLGQSVFSMCCSLKDVIIPGSVKRIQDKAFCGCTNLTTVSIGSGVTGIGLCAFEGCSRLTGIAIPGSVSSIGTFAFLSCTSLTRLTLAEGVTSLGSDAFDDCPSLTSVTIPASLTAIGAGTFNNCPGLTSVFFRGNAPQTTAWSAFTRSDQVTVYYTAGATGWGATFSGRPTVCVGSVPFDFVTDGDGVSVTDYEDGAETAVLPKTIVGLSVTTVGKNAFSGCTNLTEIFLPAGVTNLGSGAFADCPQLAAVYFEGNAPGFEPPLFSESCGATVYRRAGRSGWGATFAGRPAALWFPAESVFAAAFDAQGGTVSPVSAIVTNGLTYGTLPLPEKPGYSFAGWWTAAGGTGTLVTATTTVTVTAAHALYAKWEANSYTVTFDPSGGSVERIIMVVTSGSAYGTLPVPVRTNYTFGGWWTGEGGTGIRVTSETPVTATADHTLYAKWTGTASTVTFDAQGGTVSPGAILFC